MNLDAKIEAILFYKNEPIKLKQLAKILNIGEPDIKEGIAMLRGRLSGGVSLMQKDDEVVLSTAEGAGPIIEKLIKESLNSDLGKAALDTLTIVLYYSPVTKAEIDSIRGVNSGFILRNLLIRGLITRTQNDKDQRSFLYRPTFELFAYLGIKEARELPEYESFRETLKSDLSELEKNETIISETSN